MAETNYKLGTQLPYMFIINRLAITLKCYNVSKLALGKSAKTLSVN